MDSAKQQLIEKLKSANNVLVTVSRDPSVDQLASCIGLTLLLNKQGKHAAAVFSGEVPSTLEFLQPDATLEKNTDSLRDFIISLDRSKADKLRYKVEDNIVRIFITPYKTSISEDDLEFSEGDFNVDVVVALGVLKQEDLDEAITVHGRILHDATVTSINTAPDGGLGAINWSDQQSSSLSELVTELGEALGPNLLDNQIATALLTGIVAETDRFSNDKTSSQTMSVSAALMAAGANQQLVASKLEEGASAPPAPAPAADAAEPSDDEPPGEGMIQIDHSGEPPPAAPGSADTAASAAAEPPAPPADASPPSPPPESSTLSPGAKLVTEPPTLGGRLTANTEVDDLEPTVDPLSLPDTDRPQLLDRKPALTPTSASPPPSPAPTAPSDTAASASAQPAEPPTLSELEESVHRSEAAAANVDSARDQVDRALAPSAAEAAIPNEPIQALNAQPLGEALHQPEGDSAADSQTAPPPVPPPFTPPQ